MSLPIHVDANSGYKANERPEAFWLDAKIEGNELTGVCEIETVEDRWYDPNAEYFKVRTADGKRFILRYNERQDEWTLQIGFDGSKLLARPSVELVAVEPADVRRAESQGAGCEKRRPNDSEIPLNCVLADMLRQARV